MKITESVFIKSASQRGQYPEDGLPEVAFSGRSNVGKSSMINRLLGRHSLARTGSAPGRTRLLNFFRVNKNIYFVDLPGYGYARVPGEMRHDWKRMVEQYLEDRPQLKLVVVIVDLRRGLEDEEDGLLQWLSERGIRCCIVATKADKLTRTERAQARGFIREQLQDLDAPFIEFSAESGEGREAVWDLINMSIKQGESGEDEIQD
jgi:GTP-binding protein